MPTASEIRLNLGCGHQRLPGWVNLDSVPECHPDVVHDLREPLPFADQSVGEVLAKGLLEHFDKYERFDIFYEWARVLEIGGVMTIEVPNLEKIFWRYFKFGFDRWVEMIFGENMLGSSVYIGHYGNHKWGYSQKTLGAFAENFGVVPSRVECCGLNIHWVGKKVRHVPYSDLGRIQIYSAANAVGDKPYLPLAFVREKIAEFQKPRK